MYINSFRMTKPKSKNSITSGLFYTIFLVENICDFLGTFATQN